MDVCRSCARRENIVLAIEAKFEQMETTINRLRLENMAHLRDKVRLQDEILMRDKLEFSKTVNAELLAQL